MLKDSSLLVLPRGGVDEGYLKSLVVDLAAGVVQQGEIDKRLGHNYTLSMLDRSKQEGLAIKELFRQRRTIGSYAFFTTITFGSLNDSDRTEWINQFSDSMELSPTHEISPSFNFAASEHLSGTDWSDLDENMVVSAKEAEEMIATKAVKIVLDCEDDEEAKGAVEIIRACNGYSNAVQKRHEFSELSMLSEGEKQELTEYIDRLRLEKQREARERAIEESGAQLAAVGIQPEILQGVVEGLSTSRLTIVAVLEQPYFGKSIEETVERVSSNMPGATALYGVAVDGCGSVRSIGKDAATVYVEAIG